MHFAEQPESRCSQLRREFVLANESLSADVPDSAFERAGAAGRRLRNRPAPQQKRKNLDSRFRGNDGHARLTM